MEIAQELPAKTEELLQLVPADNVVQIFNQIIPFYIDAEKSSEIVKTVSKGLVASQSLLSTKLQM